MSRIRLHPRALLVAAAVSLPVSLLVSLSAHAVPGTRFDLYGRIGWARDSNLLCIADDAPAFDHQRSDSWTTAEFGGVLDKTWGRQRLSGVAKVSKVNFDHFRRRDYDGEDFQGSWYWQLGNAFSRVFPTVEAVIGRREESVTLPDGRIVTRLDRVFLGLEAHLVEGQVLYRDDGSFSLRVVATSGFTAADEAALLAAFRLRVPRVAVRVEQVAAIARGANGKFAFLARDG